MAAKIIIGLLLIALCALCGRALAMKSVFEADAIRRFQEDIVLLKMLTLEKRLPAAQALTDLKEPVFKRMSAYMTKDARLSLKDAWKKAAADENIKPDAGKPVEMLFGALECLLREQQSAQYERAHEDLKKLEGEKRNQGLERVKLYTSLGAVMGICIFLFCV